MAIFVGEALLLWQLSVLVYAIAVWVGAAAFVHWYEEGVGAPVRVGLRGIPARGSGLVAAAASLVAADESDLGG